MPSMLGRMHNIVSLQKVKTKHLYLMGIEGIGVFYFILLLI